MGCSCGTDVQASDELLFWKKHDKTKMINKYLKNKINPNMKNEQNVKKTYNMILFIFGSIKKPVISLTHG